MDKFIRFFPLLLLLVFISCKATKSSSSQATLPTVRGLKIKQLIADDFSENLSRLSTQNDEIILLLSFYEKEKTSAISHKIYGTFLFDKNNTKEILEDSISISSGYFIATLIELDTDRTPQEIAKDVFDIYETISHPDIEKADNKTQLELAIGDDDFLDVKYVTLSSLKKENEIKFWGIHLFDEYQYRLIIEAH